MNKIIEVIWITVLVLGAVSLYVYVEFGGLGLKAQEAVINARNKTVLKIPALVK